VNLAGGYALSVSLMRLTLAIAIVDHAVI